MALCRDGGEGRLASPWRLMAIGRLQSEGRGVRVEPQPDPGMANQFILFPESAL